MLKLGEVVAYKTDTVWGFGCNPLDEVAVSKIYEIKKRDLKKPLILMSNNFDNLKKYIKFIPNYAYDLIEKYLPGGLTLIFEKSDLCPDFIVANGNTVGIRIPDSDDFRKLLDDRGEKVLATTSCNLSNEEPVKNYSEALEKFSDIVTVIKPINDIENENVPSTVLLCEKENYKILRQGVIKL